MPMSMGSVLAPTSEPAGTGHPSSTAVEPRDDVRGCVAAGKCSSIIMAPSMLMLMLKLHSKQMPCGKSTAKC